MNKRFNELETGEKLLLLGHISAAMSALFLSLGAIWRLTGSLPTSPMQFSSVPQNPTTPQRNGSSYWDR
jgi:hypothetical protein